ncbi:MAG: response regulator transcription factor [Planctomycetaceae bacterium]|nr:response regulator transcription factor [Planctomycetaceae bacterium]
MLTRFAPDIVVIDEEILGGTPIELILRMRAEVSAERAPVFMVAVQSEAANSSSDLLDRSQPAVFNGVARIADQIAGLMNSSQHSDAEPEQIHCHGLSLDRARHCGSVAGNVLRLTPTEFKLLWKLASRPGYVLSRNELTKLCKGADGATAIQARTIDAHIKSIRRKLLERSRLIETVHGVGYRFQETSAVVG